MQSGCIWAKEVVYCQSGFFREKWLYSDKIGGIRAKVVVFRQKWLYLVIGCIRAEVVVFG